MTTDNSPPKDKELDSYNAETKDLSTAEVIQWAKKTFNNNLYALSSFGVDSAIMFEVVKQAGAKIPIITIDTGFLFEETHAFKEEMARKYDLEVITCRPSDDTIEYVKKEELWKSYPELYHELVKLEPLRDAIEEQNIKALLSGIRSDQTKIRADKHTVHRGSDGELRIHPLLNWSQEDIDTFIKENNLPRHPLYSKGYASVGDWTTTKKGATRSESRRMMSEKMECGLHVDENGKLVPLKSMRQH